MALTVTDILKFRETENDPWQRLLLQANINFNLIYPVGSIYMSTVNVNPATLFGGTWEQLEDRFLLGAGTTYTAGDTGGEATHTLTVDEMPNHRHSLLVGDGTINDYVGGSTAAYGLKSGGSTLSGSFLSAEGSGQAHNNMPPYIVVYMWKRLTLSPTIYTPPQNVLIGDVASQDIVPVSMGGTGADNATDARTNLGIVNETTSTLTITKASGWTTNNTWAERRGALVIAHVYVQGTSSNNKSIATGLPKPRSTIDVTDIGGCGIIRLNTSGSLYVQSASTGAYFGATFAYFTND